MARSRKKRKNEKNICVFYKIKKIFLYIDIFAISGLKQTVLRSKTYAMRSERTNLHF